MKKFAFITGAFSFSLTSLGVIFKMNHWHPADLLIVVGLGVFLYCLVQVFLNTYMTKENE